MYDREIKRIGELVYGPDRFSVGLALTKVAKESGVPVSKLAQALRSRRTAKDGAEQARHARRETVPNRMMTHFVER